MHSHFSVFSGYGSDLQLEIDNDKHQASSGKWECCAAKQEAEVCLIDSGLIDHLR
jgi:hypothetical protein